MKRKKHVISAFTGLLFFMASSILSAAPVISDVQASQRTDGSMIVDITYDLAGAGVEGTTIVVEASPNCGASWFELFPGESLSGDVGENIMNGENLEIVWKAVHHAPNSFFPHCYIRIFSRETHTIMLPGSVPLEMVKIFSGSFVMGSPDTQRGRLSNEGPQTFVTLTEDYYMAVYPVTQQQWMAVMNEWPDTAPTAHLGLGNNYPVYWISRDDAQDFITALNTHIDDTEQGAFSVSLPTEAQWEYACRAGTVTRFYFGDSLSAADGNLDGPTDSITYPGSRTDYMWYSANNQPDSSKEAGQKLPNAWGLYDMHGNVGEWTQDWFSGTLPGGSVIDPTGPETGTHAVRRGGTHYFGTQGNRSASRGFNLPDETNSIFGFRIIAVPE